MSEHSDLVRAMVRDFPDAATALIERQASTIAELREDLDKAQLKAVEFDRVNELRIQAMTAHAALPQEVERLRKHAHERNDAWARWAEVSRHLLLAVGYIDDLHSALEDLKSLGGTTIAVCGSKYDHDVARGILNEPVGRCWTCFHCDATFTDEKEALAHFGPYHENVNSPACARRHAKMYRWLRQHSWIDTHYYTIQYGAGFRQTKPELLDAAIDAAIAQEKQHSETITIQEDGAS